MYMQGSLKVSSQGEQTVENFKGDGVWRDIIRYLVWQLKGGGRGGLKVQRGKG